MPALPEDWVREDFLALALSYAANADLEFSEAERAHLKRLCGEAHCAKAQAYMSSLSDYEIIGAITDGRSRFFPGEDGARTLDLHLRAFFQTDDDFSQMEHQILHALERLW